MGSPLQTLSAYLSRKKLGSRKRKVPRRIRRRDEERPREDKKKRKIRWRIRIQEVLGRTNSLLSFDTIQTSQKTTPPNDLRCRGNVSTDCYLAMTGAYTDRPTYFFYKTQTAQKIICPTVLLLHREFLAAVTCAPLPSDG
jgi:hypothetical protein